MAHTTFPADLPIPQDDGACNHLVGTRLPPVALKSTTGGSSIELAQQTAAVLTILFCYPRTGAPNEVVPDSWNAIPGARGCTPQACGFRDSFDKIKSLGVHECFGISTQDTAYQQEAHQRLKLPYPLLSDEHLQFVNALNLPTFEWEGKKVIRRLALAVLDSRIIKVWYPVFPPDSNAQSVVDWLENEYPKDAK